jgi:hypothetical protein
MTDRGTSPNTLQLHGDSARPDTAKLSIGFTAFNQMNSARYSSSSLDMAPSDFFIFSHVKRKLMGSHAEELSDYLVRAPVIWSEIPRELLNAVLLDQIEQFQKWIHTNRGYIA